MGDMYFIDICVFPSINQTDQMLVHLQSFNSIPENYRIPESTKNGVPLFYIPPGSTTPVRWNTLPRTLHPACFFMFQNAFTLMSWLHSLKISAEFDDKLLRQCILRWIAQRKFYQYVRDCIGLTNVFNGSPPDQPVYANLGDYEHKMCVL